MTNFPSAIIPKPVLKLLKSPALSRHQKRYIKSDYKGILHPDWRLDLRLDEHVLAYTACNSHPETKRIAKRMKRCRLDRRCGVLLCFFCRFLHAHELNAKIQSAFRSIPTKRIRFETVLIRAIHGTPAEITRQMQVIIKDFRKANRLLAANHAIASAGTPLIKFGSIDLDVYRCADVAQLWSERSSDKRKAVKVRLFKKLGRKDYWSDYFVVVHSHAVMAARSFKKYKKAICRKMPGKRRVVAKRLFKIKPVPDSLRYLSGYISKVAGRYGPLTGSSKLLLDHTPMRDLMIALEPFSFRSLKLHIGTSRSAHRDLQNQISIADHQPGPSTPSPQRNHPYLTL